MGKNITIVDVAEQAGVSKTTISRYLNGKFEFMSEQSRQRIAQVIEELNYRPNNLARSLKSNRSRIIGVVVSDISNPFSAILLKAISDCCERYGYGVLITSTEDNPKKEREYILAMLDQRVEGIILNTTGENNDFLQSIAARKLPVILADRRIESPLFDTVRTADQEGARDMLAYVKSLNYERVVCFSETLGNIGTRIGRMRAYEQACEELFKCDSHSYILAKKNDEYAVELVKQLWSDVAGRRTAVFATNGVALLYLVKAMQRLELKFPRDLGVCGIDNWDWTELVGGGITVVSQPSYKVGRECVRRMMSRLHRNKNAAPRFVQLPCELVVRGSL